MKDVDIIDIGWTALLALWIISFLKVKRAEKKEPAGSRFGVPALYMVSTVWLFIRYFQRGMVFPAGKAYTALGVVLCYAGLLLVVWARVVLGGNPSGHISVKKGYQWTDRRPYSLARNPIDSGILLPFAGTAITVGHPNAYPAVAAMHAGILVKLRRGEPLIQEQFREKYLQYAGKVRYRLTPVIY